MTTYALVNLAWQMGGDYPLLREIARSDDRPDVILFVEGRRGNNKPVHVAEALPGFEVFQDVSGGDKAGSGIAIRRDGNIRPRRAWMRLASRSGKQVQNRYRYTLVGIDKTKRFGKKRVKLGVQHNPTAKNERHDEGMRSARSWMNRAHRWVAITGCRALLAMDSNETPEGTQNETGAARVYGRKPMCFLLTTGWGHVKFDNYDADGTDHKVLVMKEKPR